MLASLVRPAPVVLALWLATPAMSDGKRPPDLRARLESLAEPLIAGRRVHGLVVGILRKGKSAVHGFGRLSATLKRAPDGGSVFEIGSITKAFTGILLARMIQAGRVKLEDAAGKYLPAAVAVPSFQGSPITLLHLATHTSGLPRLPGNFKPKDLTNPFADYTRENLYAFLLAYRLKRKPGSRYAYSNLGMGLLGHLLARAADKTYEQLLIETICKPLAMEDTRIVFSRSMRDRLAPGHDGGLAPAAGWDIPTLAGAGAIRSSVNDLLLFLRAHLEGKGPLAAAMAEAARVRRPAGGGWGVGLGWHAHLKSRYVWHNGGTGGYHGFVAFDQGRQTAVVVLCNTSAGEITSLGHQIVALLAGEPVRPMTLRKAVKVDSTLLDRYAGVYALAPGVHITVTRRKDQLMVQVANQPVLPVFAASPDRFFWRVVDARLTFVVDARGSVEALIIHQGGRSIRAARLKEKRTRDR